MKENNNKNTDNINNNINNNSSSNYNKKEMNNTKHSINSQTNYNKETSFFSKIFSFFKKKETENNNKTTSNNTMPPSVKIKWYRHIYSFIVLTFIRLIYNPFKIFLENNPNFIKLTAYIYLIILFALFVKGVIYDFSIFSNYKQNIWFLFHLKKSHNVFVVFQTLCMHSMDNIYKRYFDFDFLKQETIFIYIKTDILKKIIELPLTFEKIFYYDWVYYQLYYLGFFFTELFDLFLMECENCYVMCVMMIQNMIDDYEVSKYDMITAVPTVCGAYFVVYSIHFALLALPLFVYWFWVLILYLTQFVLPPMNPLRKLFMLLQGKGIDEIAVLAYGVRDEILEIFHQWYLFAYDNIFYVMRIFGTRIFFDLLSTPYTTQFLYVFFGVISLGWLFFFYFYFSGNIFFSLFIFPFMRSNRLSIKDNPFLIARWHKMKREGKYYTIREDRYCYRSTVVVPIINGCQDFLYIATKKQIRLILDFSRNFFRIYTLTFKLKYKEFIIIKEFQILNLTFLRKYSIKNVRNLNKFYINLWLEVVSPDSVILDNDGPKNRKVDILHRFCLSLLLILHYGGGYFLTIFIFIITCLYQLYFGPALVSNFATRDMFDTYSSMFAPYIPFSNLSVAVSINPLTFDYEINVQNFIKIKIDFDYMLEYIKKMLSGTVSIYHETDLYFNFIFLIFGLFVDFLLIIGLGKRHLSLRVFIIGVPIIRPLIFTIFAIFLDFSLSLITKMPMSPYAPTLCIKLFGHEIELYKFYFNCYKLPRICQVSSRIERYQLYSCTKEEARTLIANWFKKIPGNFVLDEIHLQKSPVKMNREIFSEYSAIPSVRINSRFYSRETYMRDLIYFNKSFDPKSLKYKPCKIKVSVFSVLPNNDNIPNFMNKIPFEFIVSIILILFSFLTILIPILISVAYLTLFERKVIGHIQRRTGPVTVGILGLLQPIADGVKLFLKETIVPSHSNKIIYILAPLITFSLSLLNWIVIPFDLNYSIFNINLSVLFILAISSLSVYGIILAGWSSNSKYAFLGAIRSSAQMISYEISISLILLTLLLTNYSLNFIDIINNQEFLWNCLIHFPMFFLFLISILAETNRHPFDLPEAEAELVSGYNVEYSAMTFALFFLGEYANIILMSVLASLFFLGGWFFFSQISFIFISLKSLLIMFFFIWCRAAFPRYRYDQLMFLGWKILLPISISWILVTLGFLFFFDNLLIFNKV